MSIVKPFIPRHCQELMRDFALMHNRCNIWATPGTGKTGAVLVLFRILKLLGSSFFPLLVLAPKRPAYVWWREHKKWLEFEGFRVVLLTGAKDAKERAERLKQPADIYVINYDLIQWLCERLKDNWPFRAVVADESTKLRNFRLRNGGKRAAALAKISKHVGRWINLTGTPRPKDLLDLWGQMWFVDRGRRLGRTFGEFKRRWFDENLYSHAVTAKSGALEEIARAISDVTITIKAEDYFDLPPIITNDIIVQLKPETMALYDSMEQAMYLELGDTPVEAPNAAVSTMKCLQIASGAVYREDGSYTTLDDAKLEALDDLIEEADGPVLIAYHWKFDRDRISKRYSQAREIKTEASIDDWNAGRIDVGFIHPGSAGHGIDLAVGGNILVFLSQWWNLEEYLQVIERLGPTRQAQHELNRPVFLHHIIAQHTLDERVVARRVWRQGEQNQLMDLVKKE